MNYTLHAAVFDSVYMALDLVGTTAQASLMLRQPSGGPPSATWRDVSSGDLTA